MKSEKAKEFIDKYAVGSSRDAAPSMMKNRVIECIELAEQDAEERMQKRAMMAYCYAYGCPSPKTCSIGPEKCPAVAKFIQKLNDE